MGQSLHDFRFPNESEAYRSARDELLAAEIELRRETERVAAQRRALPLGGAVSSDYAFQEWDRDADAPHEVRLSELFGEKDTLFLYSFMVVPGEQGLPFVGPCPSCTSIIDSVDGALPHITRRIAFAVAAGAPIEEFRAHGERRGWRHARQLSARGTSYSRDYGAEDADGFQWPLATVFARRDGEIHHTWSSELWFLGGEEGQGPRHVDFMWPIWAVFDRTPDGRGDWEPKLDYS
ncbi:MAG TPA: DUF899 family protein [Solirubrobacteraceae bacterium]|jgi:predicted dithiol-disulfide oxidoreductase (DUF899 family)|nr:DUF899 family protein [Solirubrobacteraceae bacterium]